MVARFPDASSSRIGRSVAANATERRSLHSYPGMDMDDHVPTNPDRYSSIFGRNMVGCRLGHEKSDEQLLSSKGCATFTR